MAAENIDGTANGSGFFPTKVPGLSDAADIQAALRLYHYGSYTYDGSNTNKANIVNPSIAKHLQNLADADALEVINRNAAIADAISGATGAYSDLAGNGIDWNSVDERFDIQPRILNVATAITKSSSFTLEPDDVSKTILLSASAPMTLTIPANSSVAIPVGYQYHFVEIGTERTTFAPAAGVTIGSKNSQLFLDGRYSKGSLVKVSTNEWVLFGDIYEGVATPTPTPTTPTPTPTTPTPTPTTPTPTPTTPTPTPETPVPTTPTPTSTVTYWTTGCCEGPNGGRQVTGTSTENAPAAAGIAINNCNGAGETLQNAQEGSYTTTSNIPTLTCSAPPTPTPTGPTVYNIYTACDPLIPASRGGYYGTQTASGYVNVGTTTNPSLSSEEIVALLGYGSSCPPVPNPGTIYLSYCSNGAPVTSGPVTIDGNNFISSNINTACADYTSFLTNSGATNISCSTVSQPAAPTNCSTAPTPSTPTPSTPTPTTPTPTTPTPTPETPAPTFPVPSGGGCVPGELCQAIESGGCYYIYTYTASCGCSLSSTVC